MNEHFAGILHDNIDHPFVNSTTRDAHPSSFTVSSRLVSLPRVSESTGCSPASKLVGARRCPPGVLPHTADNSLLRREPRNLEQEEKTFFLICLVYSPWTLIPHTPPVSIHRRRCVIVRHLRRAEDAHGASPYCSPGPVRFTTRPPNKNRTGSGQATFTSPSTLHSLVVFCGLQASTKHHLTCLCTKGASTWRHRRCCFRHGLCLLDLSAPLQSAVHGSVLDSRHPEGHHTP